MAHDLRTPLGAITMKARYLLDALLPDDDAHRRARDEVAGIVRGAHMMERLVGDLLDASSIGAGTFRIVSAVHDTHVLAADAVDALTALTTTKQISLVSRIEMRSLACDHDRVQQVLTNLLGNALKFSPIGGTVELVGRAGDDHYTFEITDSGPGIPSEIADRVFEAFVHGASRGADAAGLGLGLFIAHAIVDAHGGRLWIERTGPTGTTMCIELPG